MQNLLPQVRSLTLDVRVWDGPVMALMAALGNAAANAVWEAALRRVSAQADSWVCPLAQPTSRCPRAGLDLFLYGRLGHSCCPARPAAGCIPATQSTSTCVFPDARQAHGLPMCVRPAVCGWKPGAPRPHVPHLGLCTERTTCPATATSHI